MTIDSQSHRSRVYRTEAIVLKGYDYGEADRILTLQTPNLGKIRAIAKGVRRVKSRKAGHLDLFTRSRLSLHRGRQLDIITEADTLESFSAMRTDLLRSSYTHYVAELIDDFSPEALPNPAVYALAVHTFRRLANGNTLELAVRSFELQLLGLMGYRPQLHSCLACGAAIEPQINRFSPRMGGVLCPNCVAVDGAAPAISVEALKMLRNLQTNETAVLALTGVDSEVQREVERRLQEYIIYRLESRPRSISVLDRLRTEDP